jgi:hypothetical protein
MYLFSNERFGIIFKPINPHILSSNCVNSPIISAWSKSFFFLFFFFSFWENYAGTDVAAT